MKVFKQLPLVNDNDSPRMHPGQVFTLIAGDRVNYVYELISFLSCRCGIWGAYRIKLITIMNAIRKLSIKDVEKHRNSL